MELRRGDIVSIAEGKPRPAVIVQADAMPSPVMVLICPLTSTLVDAPYYRPTVLPDPVNGLQHASQCMADRLGAVRRDRIGTWICRLSNADIQRLDVALMLILGIAAR